MGQPSDYGAPIPLDIGAMVDAAGEQGKAVKAKSQTRRSWVKAKSADEAEREKEREEGKHEDVDGQDDWHRPQHREPSFSWYRLRPTRGATLR
jgi:hypothetical protein